MTLVSPHAQALSQWAAVLTPIYRQKVVYRKPQTPKILRNTFTGYRKQDRINPLQEIKAKLGACPTSPSGMRVLTSFDPFYSISVVDKETLWAGLYKFWYSIGSTCCHCYVRRQRYTSGLVFYVLCVFKQIYLFLRKYILIYLDVSVSLVLINK